jgi:hypothetical protein
MLQLLSYNLPFLADGEPFTESVAESEPRAVITNFHELS